MKNPFRRSKPEPERPPNVELYSTNLDGIDVGVFGQTPDQREGFKLLDREATGELHSRIPTPFPRWGNLEYGLTEAYEHGSSLAQRAALFGAEPNEKEDYDDE